MSGKSVNFVGLKYIVDKMRLKSFPSIFNILIFLLVCVVFSGCSDREKAVQESITKADTLIAEQQYDDALEILLSINSELDDNTSPEVKEKIASRLANVYYNKYQRGKAHEQMLKAVEYSRESGNNETLGINLWNVALTVSDLDSLTEILSECRDLSRLSGNKFIENRARIYLCRFAAWGNDLEKAKLIYDSIAADNDNNRDIALELKFLLADLEILENDYDGAVNTLNAIKNEKLSLDGKLTFHNRMYQLTKKQGKYDEAFAHSDSISLYKDSINTITNSDRTSKIEIKYAEKLIREQWQRNLIIGIGICVTAILLIIIYFQARQRRLKARQLALIEKISALNVRISELTQTPTDTTPSSEVEQSVAEKFRLNREFFHTLPQYSALKQLNMLRDANEIDRQRAKEVLDAVIGQFADACANLCQLFPSMTNDDSLYCAVIYSGFSKEAASVALKASEDALRRRKSRIKQKLSAEMFEFIFS